MLAPDGVPRRAEVSPVPLLFKEGLGVVMSFCSLGDGGVHGVCTPPVRPPLGEGDRVLEGLGQGREARKNEYGGDRDERPRDAIGDDVAEFHGTLLVDGPGRSQAFASALSEPFRRRNPEKNGFSDRPKSGVKPGIPGIWIE